MFTSKQRARGPQIGPPIIKIRKYNISLFTGKKNYVRKYLRTKIRNQRVAKTGKTDFSDDFGAEWDPKYQVPYPFFEMFCQGTSQKATEGYFQAFDFIFDSSENSDQP